MKYKKCPRCELNYIMDDSEFCELCNRELAGEVAVYDFCIICGIELDEGDYDICKACKRLEDDSQTEQNDEQE